MKTVITYSFLEKKASLFILLAAAFLFFANSWGFPIYILDEAKNAECAREMWEQGDYIVPTFNYELRTDKPPLHYFFMSISYSIFGATPFAARFFAALLGIGCVWLSFFYAKKELGQLVGLLAATILLASIHFVFQFHLAVPDAYLIFFLTVSIFSFYNFIEQKNKIQLWIGYATVALGTLAKGPVALGLVGLVMLLYLLFSKKMNWKTLQALQIPLGGLLFLGIALPWYIAVGQATAGEWLEGFFFQHNFSRFGATMEGHGGGFWMTWLYVLLGLFPFSVLLPQSLHRAWKAWQQPFIRLCLLAAVVIVGFFSLSSTKLPNYTVPAYPFLAILIGYFLKNALGQANFKKNYGINWSFVIGLILSIGLSIGAYFGLKNYPLLHDLSNLAWVFLPLVLAFSSIFLFKKHWIWHLSLGAMMSTCLLFYIAVPNVMNRNPVQQSAKLLIDKKVLAYKRFNPAYSFHLQRHIPVLESPEEVQKLLQSETETVILSFTKYSSDLSFLQLDTLFQQQDLFEGTTTIILKSASEKPN